MLPQGDGDADDEGEEEADDEDDPEEPLRGPVWIRSGSVRDVSLARLLLVSSRAGWYEMIYLSVYDYHQCSLFWGSCALKFNLNTSKYQPC